MEYANLSMAMETAVVVDAIITATMKDSETATKAYLDTLSVKELESIKSDMIVTGAEILKSVKYINELLCDTK